MMENNQSIMDLRSPPPPSSNKFHAYLALFWEQRLNIEHLALVYL